MDSPVTTPPESAARIAPYLEVFAIAYAVILLEISFTRVFSFKLYYYFTYLVIGIALLGVGTGGVIVTLFRRVRAVPMYRLLAACCLLASLSIIIGYEVVARTPLSAFGLLGGFGEYPRLLAITASVFVPFLVTGVALAAVFAANPGRINSLYAADLVGAGLGCALCIPLMYLLTPPGCILLAALVLAVAGFHAASKAGRVLRWASLGMAASAAAILFVPGWMPELVVDPVKTMGHPEWSKNPIVFSRWNPVFRVDVMQHPLLDGSSYLINHDGNMGSTLHRFDGDLSKLTRFDSDPRALPFEVVAKHPRTLIIGAAGGHEILAALYFGAEHVTGVELNPVTVSLLTTHFADYTGHLHEHERVSLVNDEGRSFLRRAREPYDLVWLVAPDSYAAMNAATSGAFVLSESYLYTAEMIEESFDKLGPDGVVCAHFGEFDYDRKPNRTLRYLSTAREALRRRGISDFQDHVLVATTPDILNLSTVLLKKSPFTREEIARFTAAASRIPGTVIRAAPALAEIDTRLAPVLTATDEELASWYDAQRYTVGPITDDGPFFWHFVRFADAALPGRAETLQASIEEFVGERLVLVLLLFATGFAAVALAVPMLAIRPIWRSMPQKLRAVLYFAALGLGFMFFEISLVQMLTLFLGYPTYSLSVTLFSVLVFAGFGSLITSAYRGDWRRGLRIAVAVLVVLTLFYEFVMPMVIRETVGLPLPARALIATLMIAPLGLTLGTFMPLGLRVVAALSPHAQEYVAWSWAVNGFCSVIGSILSTVLAMSIGFKLLLAVALLTYVTGVAVLSTMRLVRGAAV
jgi:hypothetical protein